MLRSDPNFATGLSDPRILVTGGSGFIGTNLVAAYIRAGVPVINLDVVAPRDPGCSAAWVRGDVRHLDVIRSAVLNFRPTHVFHLAARTDLKGQHIDDYDTNVTGVMNLLSALQAAPHLIERAVIASSRLVCRIGYQPRWDDDFCPTTAYGQSKVATERLVRDEKTVPWVLVRPTSIWGPWFGVPYRDFFLSVARGRYVHPAERQIHKSFGFVGNTTWQLHRVMTAPASDVLGRTFYLADDPPIEVGDFANRISAAIGRRPPRAAPLSVLRAIAGIGDVLERVGLRAPLTSFRLANLLTPVVHDVGALIRITGGLPYGEAEGVAITVAWMRRQGLLDARS